MFFPPTTPLEDFQTVLRSFETIPPVEIQMSMLSRGQKDLPYEAGSCWIVRLDGRKRFSISASGLWGDEAGRYISDGKTLLILGDSNVLKNAPDSVSEISSAFNPQFGCVLFELLKGARQVDSLLGPDKRVERTPLGLKVWTRNFGVLDITIHQVEGKLLPVRIVASDRASKMANYLLFPVFSDKPEDPQDMLSIGYNFVRSFPRGTFDTRLPKGLVATDQRKKKP
ncbi:MAG: hypothetical protein ABL949_04630 [Fimbriimonadaceae bacterium]